MSWQRYVALGDSFTEGVGDPDPERANGVRGWADRVAEVLAAREPGFGYANLAIRGRKLTQIIDEQLDPALSLTPDLITIHGGGNDVLRPRVDIDALIERYDAAVARLAATGATVAMFTLFDPGRGGVFGSVRGRMAIFNEGVREIVDRRGVVLVDMWRMREVDLREVMDSDRMHLNSRGHRAMATAVLAALGVEQPGADAVPDNTPVRRAAPAGRAQRWRENAAWTREFLVPWVHRRLTGRSSGDGLSPRRPGIAPVE